MYKPTPQQISILECNDNCVVIAGPGSGKTSTIAHKINSVVTNLKWYEGVAAISYTNKASGELRDKSKSLCPDLKNSVFSTIDSFYIGNIIIPFGKRFFGLPKKNLSVEKMDSYHDNTINEIVEEVEGILSRYKNCSVKELEKNRINLINKLRPGTLKFISINFKDGIFDLRLVGGIANLIFLSSKSCRNYFKARYKYLFIDEFQDSGENQYYLFLRISEINVKCWAIGDINQSIFRFANKDAKYLKELLNNKRFNKFPMDINHRCHQSIDLYSRKLLGFNELPTKEENRVFNVFVKGNECDIGVWFQRNLNDIKSTFNVKSNSKIGVLAKKNITLEKFLEKIDVPYRLFKQTVLDDDRSLCGGLLNNLIKLALEKRSTAYNFVDKFLDREISSKRLVIQKTTKLVQKFKDELKEFMVNHNDNSNEIVKIFNEICAYIYPNTNNDSSINNLKYLLENKVKLNDFLPAEDDEIQLMNLYKSKGLEFDVVIHLDLYQYILPEYDWIQHQDYENYLDSLNLHYVGVTRAVKALFLLSSNERYQVAKDKFIRAETSEFLSELQPFQSLWEESLF
mgnify:CR=1 FL=1